MRLIISSYSFASSRQQMMVFPKSMESLRRMSLLFVTSTTGRVTPRQLVAYYLKSE
jgi:hypothetical protein